MHLIWVVRSENDKTITYCAAGHTITLNYWNKKSPGGGRRPHRTQATHFISTGDFQRSLIRLIPVVVGKTSGRICWFLPAPNIHREPQLLQEHDFQRHLQPSRSQMSQFFDTYPLGDRDFSHVPNKLAN